MHFHSYMTKSHRTLYRAEVQQNFVLISQSSTNANPNPNPKIIYSVAVHFFFQEIFYSSFQFYFELTVQKRQNDLRYLQLLRNIRTQQVTDRDYDYLINTCPMPNVDEFDLERLLATPVIVSSNEIRYRWEKIYSNICAANGDPDESYNDHRRN
ncbi:hypothetical protein BC833DRAFT_639302 [Globomyces pollinis-pini]|nr:hypothetical protein BC833DRAFT_639302 [Globomyces pollinis-pini]